MKPERQKLFPSDEKTAQQVLEQLFRKQHARLVQFAIRLCNDHFAAEEIVMDLFMDLWKRRDTISLSTNENAYLNRAVINKVYDYLKKKNKADQTISYPEKAPLVVNTNIQDKALFAKELEERIQAVIEKLPPRCKLIFKLNRFEQRSYKEIAEDLNISPKAVEKQISRALSILRKAIF
ncbi:MAG: RNA polymerase sigma-70 factor [Bacteroidota bacterium]